MDYIFLDGYISNTRSDTELHAGYQLRAERSTWPVEKNIYNQAKLGKIEKLGGKT